MFVNIKNALKVTRQGIMTAPKAFTVAIFAGGAMSVLAATNGIVIKPGPFIENNLALIGFIASALVALGSFAYVVKSNIGPGGDGVDGVKRSGGGSDSYEHLNAGPKPGPENQSGQGSRNANDHGSGEEKEEVDKQEPAEKIQPKIPVGGSKVVPVPVPVHVPVTVTEEAKGDNRRESAGPKKR